MRCVRWIEYTFFKHPYQTCLSYLLYHPSSIKPHSILERGFLRLGLDFLGLSPSTKKVKKSLIKIISTDVYNVSSATCRSQYIGLDTTAQWSIANYIN